MISKDNFTLWTAQDATDTAFICEKGNVVLDYLGCYNATGLTWDYNTTEYDQMTIQQCVEWCKGGSRVYAFLYPTQCACSNSLTEPTDGDYCYSSCFGQENQVCGGSEAMSVYNVCKYMYTEIILILWKTEYRSTITNKQIAFVPIL